MGEKTSLTLKIIAASLFTMLVVVFLFTDSFSFGQADSGASEDVAGDALVGTAEGHNGPLTVAVTMDGDTITEVTVTEHSETEGLADPAIEEVPAAIVDSNSTDVDTVSGATVTSNAIMSAVEDAISGGGSAGGDSADGATVQTVEGHNGPITVEVTMDGDTITDVTVTEHSETEGLADPAIEEVPAAIVESNSTDVDTVSGATITSNAIIEAVSQVVSGADSGAAASDEAGELTDGTYEGYADGHNGPMTVEVTVEAGEIANIVITEHEESEGISDPAFEEVPAAIMEANSTDVDTVSGATVSSHAIINAVETALENAR